GGDEDRDDVLERLAGGAHREVLVHGPDRRGEDDPEERVDEAAAEAERAAAQRGPGERDGGRREQRLARRELLERGDERRRARVDVDDEREQPEQRAAGLDGARRGGGGNRGGAQADQRHGIPGPTSPRTGRVRPSRWKTPPSCARTRYENGRP